MQRSVQLFFSIPGGNGIAGKSLAQGAGDAIASHVCYHCAGSDSLDLSMIENLCLKHSFLHTSSTENRAHACSECKLSWVSLSDSVERPL